MECGDVEITMCTREDLALVAQTAQITPFPQKNCPQEALSGVSGLGLDPKHLGIRPARDPRECYDIRRQHPY